MAAGKQACPLRLPLGQDREQLEHLALRVREERGIAAVEPAGQPQVFAGGSRRDY